MGLVLAFPKNTDKRSPKRCPVCDYLSAEIARLRHLSLHDKTGKAAAVYGALLHVESLIERTQVMP